MATALLVPAAVEEMVNGDDSRDMLVIFIVISARCLPTTQAIYCMLQL